MHVAVASPDEHRVRQSQYAISEAPQRCRCFQMQPAATEHDIACENGCSGDKRKWLKGIRDAPAEMVASHGDALNEATDNQSLHRGRHDRSDAEGDIPHAAPLACHLIAKIEGDTT
jgi:hypothetical protein